jgi:hypothetical protein
MEKRKPKFIAAHLSAAERKAAEERGKRFKARAMREQPELLAELEAARAKLNAAIAATGDDPETIRPFEEAVNEIQSRLYKAVSKE